jgi:signal peptidase I
MEWFASMPLQWVVVIVIALLAVRFALKKVDNQWAKTIAETAESLALAFALVFLIIRPFLVQAYFIPSESMEPGLIGGINQKSDHLLANKAVYRLRAPRHGDIVVFKAPPALEKVEGGKKDYIKRCIGVPGDTIEVRQGYVYINGIQYNHNMMKDKLNDYYSRLRFYPNYILLGDRKISKKEIAETIGIADAKVVIKPGVVIRNGKALDEPYINEDPDYDLIDTLHVNRIKVPADNFFMMGDNRNNSMDSHMWSFLPRKYVEGKAMFIFWPLNRIRLIR